MFLSIRSDKMIIDFYKFINKFGANVPLIEKYGGKVLFTLVALGHIPCYSLHTNTYRKNT